MATKKIIIYIFSVAISVVIGFAGGVYYGFNEGIKNFSLLDKVLASNIDILRANDLRSGSEKELKHVYWHFELSVNEGMDYYYWYQKDGNHFLSELFLSGHLEHLENSVKNLAVYRSENPIEGNETDNLLCQLPESREDKRNCLGRLKARQELVEKYDKKS